MNKKSKRTLLLALLVCLLALVVGGYLYVRMHPLVFNESFLQHAHCIACVAGALDRYASDHDGHFPSSPKGYADALALIDSPPWMLTGPGYTASLPESAKQGDIPEELCGRVYIQGLKITIHSLDGYYRATTDDPEIAILFDKKATPGGDHCHGLARLRAPLGREVLFTLAYIRFIPQSEWADFASQQIERLVAAGMPRNQAQWYYDQVDK